MIKNPVVQFISRGLVGSGQPMEKRHFECTTAYGTEVMIHEDLNGEIILTVKQKEDYEQRTKTWILQEKQ